MKKKQRKRLTSEWPDYLRQPIFLTKEEIAQPEGVLKDFFERYNLIAFRACLDEVRDMALLANIDGGDYSDLIYTLENAKRLTEACWLIYKRRSGDRPS